MDENEILIPSLPNDIGGVILSHICYTHIPRLKSICKSWRNFLSSKPLTHRPKQLTTSLICIFPKDPSLSSPYLLHPPSLAWHPLPPAPCDPNLYALCNFSALPSPWGPQLFLLGGSLFDARSFPLDRPTPSPSVLLFDFPSSRWRPLSPMISPRGGFASVASPSPLPSLLVAGGGSRHSLFAAAGSRTCSAERYLVHADRWEPLEGMPSLRAGCVGFLVLHLREFRVLGGYGGSRTLSGVFPVDEECRGVVALCLDSGRWREVGDMWDHGERARNGKIVVVEGDADRLTLPRVYMLDGIDLLRYDISLNRWYEESRVPKEAPLNSSFGFVVSDGELLVVTNHQKAVEPTTDIWKTRQVKKIVKLHIQIYNPKSKTWRSRVAKSPFDGSVDFNTAVMCNIHL